MNFLEFEEVVKIHIVGDISIKNIADAYGVTTASISQAFYRYGIKTNKHCMTPSSLHKACNRCSRVLLQVRFSKNGVICRECESNRPSDNTLTIYRKRIRNLYKLTEQDLRDMQDDQKGCCDICGKSLDDLCIDHDHITGNVRGLLCRTCNTGIGQLDDSVKLLKSAITYLEKGVTL